MDDLWYAAFCLLLLLSLVNAAFLVAVMRQVGVLHQRLRPTGPGDHEGPAIGRRLPRLAFAPVRDGELSGVFERPVTVLGYVSPGCGLCGEFVPILQAFARDRPEEVDVLVATAAAPQQATDFAEEHAVKLPFGRHPDLVDEYELPGSPYALALARDGERHVRVVARGVVNTLEQLEDLVQIGLDNYVALDHEPLPAQNGNGSGNTLSVITRPAAPETT